MPQVKIRIERGVETAGDGQELQENRQRQIENRKVAIATMFAHQMINTSEGLIKTSLGRVGDRTGDYVRQANINAMLDLIGDVANIGGGIATSIATENPVPAIMSMVSVGIKYGQKYYEINRENQHAQYQHEFLLARSGNSTTNGSRGTEN